VDLTFAGKSSERNMKMSAEWNECDSKRSVYSEKTFVSSDKRDW
jgi:hypothetical protein